MPSKKIDSKGQLREFMEALKNWPAESPPSRAEYNALKQKFQLSRDEEFKLNGLAEKHIQRGRSALSDELAIQAAEEFSRAAQLKPYDPLPKIELASVLIDGISSELLGRITKEKIFKLLDIILKLQPGNRQAKALLARSRRLFRQKAGSRRYVFLILALTLFLTAFIVGRTWFVNFINRSSASPVSHLSQTDTSETQSITVDTSGLENEVFMLDIISATAGNQNDASWLKLLGRLKAENKGLNTLTLGIQGRAENGKRLFLMPWSVLDQRSPTLLSGDTLPVQTWRWLAENAEEIQSITLNILEEEHLEEEIPIKTVPTDMVWETIRPQGASLSAEFRNPQWIEAFDRQIFMADIAVTNTGTSALGLLNLNVSPAAPAADGPLDSIQMANPDSAPMLMGERRVAAISMSIPLDVQTGQARISIKEAQQANSNN